MLKSLAKGLLGSLLGYGGLLLGFWLLREAFIEVNYPLGVLGGLAILAAMYMIAVARSPRPNPSQDQLSNAELSKTEEVDPGDSLDGGNESDQLPP